MHGERVSAENRYAASESTGAANGQVGAPTEGQTGTRPEAAPGSGANGTGRPNQ
jgi:hypothetical protein